MKEVFILWGFYGYGMDREMSIVAIYDNFQAAEKHKNFLEEQKNMTDGVQDRFFIETPLVFSTFA